MIVRQKPKMVELTSRELHAAVYEALLKLGVQAPCGVHIHSVRAMCADTPQWLPVSGRDEPVLTVEIRGTGLEPSEGDNEPVEG